MKKIRAALTLFTRVPAWKWGELDGTDYQEAVVYWPYTGWLTGGLMGFTIYFLSLILPIMPTVAIAIIFRLLFTGCLHEDGLADFGDGFGGGKDKEGILRIMKDSHIGTYGVISLIAYFILLWSLLSSLPPLLSALSIFAADPFSKFCGSQITNLLGYARKEGPKNQISYERMSPGKFIINLAGGIIPFVPLALINPVSIAGIAFPVIILAMLITEMKKRIGGYTGDCCGATYLICEVALLTGIEIFLFI